MLLSARCHMITCPKCGQVTEVHDIGNGVLAGGFHSCNSKSPCTTHYACECLMEKIAALEATIKTYCEETSRLNIDRNRLEAKIAKLRKAIEPFITDSEDWSISDLM